MTSPDYSFVINFMNIYAIVFLLLAGSCISWLIFCLKYPQRVKYGQKINNLKEIIRKMRPFISILEFPSDGWKYIDEELKK